MNAIFGGIVRSLQRGERVEVRGFGMLGLRQRRARLARNPKTGARVSVPEKCVVFFKASRELLRIVNASAGPDPLLRTLDARKTLRPE